MEIVPFAKESYERIIVAFPYNLLLVARVKTIPDYRLHPKEKRRSPHDSNRILTMNIRDFGGGEIHLDPTLQANILLLSKIEISFCFRKKALSNKQ